MTMRAFIFSILMVFIASCGTTGQRHVAYEAVATGTATTSRSFGAWQVSLTRADIAIGPIYFCAATSASMDLCPQAVEELDTAALVHGLDASEQSLGMVDGVVGTMRSAKYDLGRAWLLTEQNITPDRSAPNGHSVVLEGTATNGTASFEFVATIDVEPKFAGGFAIAGQTLDADVTSEQTKVVISFDPFLWLTNVNFDALNATQQKPVVIRSGYAPDAGGNEDARQLANDAILLGITNGARPIFTWSVL